MTNLSEFSNEDLEYYQKFFQVSNDLFCLVTMEGTFSRVNPAFTKVLGWKPEELLHHPVFDLIHPDDLPVSMEQLQSLNEGIETVNFVNRWRKKSGDYVWLQWMATPEPASGNIFAVARDISRIVKQERQLQESEHQFSIFFRNSKGMMCMHDLEGKLLAVNLASAESLGYLPEDLIGGTLWDIIPEIYSEGVHEYLNNIKKEKQASGIMHTRHRNGGIRIWLYNNVLEHSIEGYPYVIANALDITERHELERNLKWTTQMLEQTNRVARIGFWQYDFFKGQIYWSDVTCAIHEVPEGYVPVREKAMTFYKVAGRHTLEAALNRAIQFGTPYDLELEIVTAEGKELWIRVICSPEMRDGKCIRLYGTFQDIDRQKRLEEEIQRARKLLEDLVQSATHVSIIATGLDGSITLFNKGAEKLLGYHAREMIGKQTPLIIHDPVELEQRAAAWSVSGLALFAMEALQDGDTGQGEWTYIRKDGSSVDVLLSFSAIRNVENELTGYLHIATDITNRKQAERQLLDEKAKLSAFIEHSPAATLMLDKELNVVAYSNSWLEQAHLTEEEVNGKSVYDMLPEMPPEFQSSYQNALAGNIVRNEAFIWRPPGWEQDQHLRWEVRPWMQEEGVIGGITILTEDITEKAKYQDELRYAKLLAEQASVAKSEFLANMSHEIRTPLNGIIGFTDLVLKTNLNETQYQYLSIVNKSAGTLLNIINDILDFSKIEAGKLELDVQRADLVELSSQVSDMVKFQAQSKDLEMIYDIAPELPRFIWTDQLRLKQILVNLLSNAVKFTEKGEVGLKIFPVSAPDEAKRQTIRFEVSDTGIGIKPERQSKIFEAFSQEDLSITKRYGGTGLGLTISNKLLDLMDSHLQLNSEPGTGSTFFFEVELQTEDGPPLNKGQIGSIKRVLITDDNEHNRTILKQMLLLKEIEVDMAKNGFEALKLLMEGHSYDVVLMDYHMPVMDGLETLRKMRQMEDKAGTHTPVVFLYSSSDDETVLRACEELKVEQRLIKPVKIQELYYALAHLSQSASQANSAEKTRQKREAGQSPVKILLAEDNSINMLLIKTIISRAQPHTLILEANTGAGAVRLFQQEQPDLVFMDIQMPELNGYDATRQIREQFPDKHTPIIALTAGNTMGERERCLEAGMDDFVAKPFLEEDILSMISKWTEGNNVSASPALDISVLMNYLGSANEADPLLRETLTLLLDDCNAVRTELEENDLRGNDKRISQICHSMRSVTTYAGLYNLEKVLRETESIGATEPQLQLLRKELDNAIVSIQQTLDRLP